MNQNDTLLVPVEQLASSKLNPRQHFDEEHIKGLAASLAKDGLLENLIVRPFWCAGITSRHEIESHESAKYPAEANTGPFEIVSGDCRWRAAKIAKIPALTCRVRLLTDPELEEINLTEQMHRNQLTPMEEARSFSRLMAYRNDDGTPRHTAESLAAAISKTADIVYNRLQLLKLPAVATKALESGKLGMTTAERIARIPDAAMATEAAKAILKGLDGEPMSFRQAQTYIAEHCMKALNGAPFDLADDSLVKHLPEFSPHASCNDCPFRTGNNKERFGDVKRGDICTRPACYAAKVEAAFARASAEAEKAGRKVLTAAESEKEFPSFQQIGELAFSSPYAKLDSEPAAHLLKSVVKNAPTYRELVEKLERAGMKPTVYLARDQAGKSVELVKVEQIVTGAEKAGEPVFREKSGPRPAPSADDKKMREEQKRLAQEAAVNEKVLLACMKAVHHRMAETKLEGLWELLLLLQLEGDPAAYSSWRLLAKMLGAKPTSDAIRAKVKSLSFEEEQLALVPLALIGNALVQNGLEVDGFQKMAAHVGVKLRAVEKEVRAGAAEKPAKKTPERKAKTGRKVPERTIKHAKGDAGDRAIAAIKASRKPAKRGGAK